MELNKKELAYLVQEIKNELGARVDGSQKNLISSCPHCHKEGKFGIYVGKDTERKKMFMSHCFRCGNSTTSLEQLLSLINRPDLVLNPTTEPGQKLINVLTINSSQEIDDTLLIIPLPDFYTRCFLHPYLKSRGFTMDDYEFFPVGITGKLNYKYQDYILFPIIDCGDVVGYVARHFLSKEEIERHNRAAKRNGKYQILRFRNSVENEFVKLLYNIDKVIEDETDTIILAEGIFDVISLTRKLDLYENTWVTPVASFGKKISLVQIYKLQSKGVKTIVLAYDGDAVDTIKKTAADLSTYFTVFIADIPYPDKDWEDLNYEEIYEIFSTGLKTPLEYKINKIQQYAR